MAAREQWTTDLKAFVSMVGDLFGRGLSSEAVTKRFAGRDVTWTGVVAETRLVSERPGVQMTMPEVDVKLPDGRRASVNYLFLTFSEDDGPKWDGIQARRDGSFPNTNPRIERPVRWN